MDDKDQFIQISMGYSNLHALDGYGHVWRFQEISDSKGKWVRLPTKRDYDNA